MIPPEDSTFNYLFLAISMIAWTYFLFDRSGLLKRIDKHGLELDDIRKTEASLISKVDKWDSSDTLRAKLLEEQLSNLKSMLVDIKDSQKNQDQDIRKLNEKFVDAIIQKNHEANRNGNN